MGRQPRAHPCPQPCPQMKTRAPLPRSISWRAALDPLARCPGLSIGSLRQASGQQVMRYGMSGRYVFQSAGERPEPARVQAWRTRRSGAIS